jgi:hypothetical protein
MPLNAAKRLLPDRGQSLVETVVMLPVLLMVFLGLDYFYELVSMRARAIEGARFATWESSWYLRDKGTEGNAERPLPDKPFGRDTFYDALVERVGIGRFLLENGGVAADAATRKLADYNDDVTAALGITSVAPRATADIVVPLASAASTAVTLIDGTDGRQLRIGGSPFLGGVAGARFTPGSLARDGWDHEADS